jgi:membrane dipeptidase
MNSVKSGLMASVAVLAFSLISSAAGAADAPDSGLDAKARAIHAASFTVDSHVDVPSDLTFSPLADPAKRGPMQVDLPKMDEGGLKAAFFIVYMGQTKRDEAGYDQAYARAMVKFNAIKRMTELYPKQIALAHSVADARKISASGRKVAFIGIENGYAIGKDLSRLIAFHHLGARYMTLAHIGHNDIADSSIPRADLGDVPEENKGLSPFGRQVIAEMNRVGIMVDVSHTSKATTLQAVQASKAPVIASHSNTRALCDVPRNLDDESIRAIASTGGVIQTVALDAYVRKATPEKAAAAAEMMKQMQSSARGEDVASWMAGQEATASLSAKFPKADVAAFVDHIDHIVQVAGIDHVGISSDFGGGGGITGWNDASETLNITRELVKRGYSKADIGKIWGGNLMRVLAKVEAIAKASQK